MSNDVGEARIQFVLVLYGADLLSSVTYGALKQCEVPFLLVCDNTPGFAQPLPEGFQGTYLRQPSNPGLAHSYNRGLSEALRNRCEWLVLLDQDTELTSAYLAKLQVAAERWRHDATVVAVVPKLSEKGIVQSPHPPILLKRAQPIANDFSGTAPSNWSYYNSGAMLRVQRLQDVGGFPERFWLDFLDHAIFRLLQAESGRVEVLPMTLQHALSTNEAPRQDSAFLSRKRNIREAENLYYRTFGSTQERFFYRLRMVYDMAVSIKHLETERLLHQCKMLLQSFSSAHADKYSRYDNDRTKR